MGNFVQKAKREAGFVAVATVWMHASLASLGNETVTPSVDARMTKTLLPLFATPALLFVAACGDTAPATDPATTDTSVATQAPPVASEPADPAPTPATDDRLLRLTGIGAQRVGAAPLTTGPDAIAEDGLQISDTCRVLAGPALLGVYVLTDGKTIGRITADGESKVVTDRGIGVGATEAAVREKYAPLREEGHKYVPAPGKNLDWEPNGPNGPAMRFEIGETGRVTAVHAGVPPILHYVEGCA